MAMTVCPECDHPVSSKAYNCPGCGYPLNKQQKTGLWWGLGCLLAIPALFIVISTIGLLAAIGIPSFQKARENAIEKACINNMRILDATKDAYAVENGLDAETLVTAENLSEHIPGGVPSIVCAKGGTYTLNPVGCTPECSVHGTFMRPDRP
jgi:hypothetical protein